MVYRERYFLDNHQENWTMQPRAILKAELFVCACVFACECECDCVYIKE